MISAHQLSGTCPHFTYLKTNQGANPDLNCATNAKPHLPRLLQVSPYFGQVYLTESGKQNSPSELFKQIVVFFCFLLFLVSLFSPLLLP